MNNNEGESLVGRYLMLLLKLSIDLARLAFLVVAVGVTFFFCFITSVVNAKTLNSLHGSPSLRHVTGQLSQGYGYLFLLLLMR